MTRKNRKLKIEYRKRSELSATEGNPRTHTRKQVEEIVSSIREFGFTNPLLIDENDGIIAGHGRELAAGVLDMDEVPTICLPGLTEAQRRAYVIADNKLALNAGWDSELLALDIEALVKAEFDVSLTGFDELELVPYTGMVNGEAYPDLSSADRGAFQRMAFVLHDDQVKLVKTAIVEAKKLGAFEEKNHNRNGNALARICEYFLKRNA